MLEYKIRKSAIENQKNPSIILLHGYGSDENDLFSFAEYLPKKYTIISLRAPFETPMGGYCWFSINFNNSNEKWSDHKQAYQSILNLESQIDFFIQKYNLEPDQIDLLGFSQGAVLSWTLLLDFSIKINRAVCLSGYIDKSLLKEDIYSYRDIIAYSSHGTNDPVIPFDWAKTSIESLKENNPNVVFNSFQDAHNVSQENFQSILNWL
ncbi:MAG: phospholipase [Flavobacteriaceae bacterium]|nr:phospholipase [Flavobacteriaceae bacterium]